MGKSATKQETVCASCGAGLVNGGVCQSCGHDRNAYHDKPPVVDRYRAERTAKYSCHPYFSRQEPKMVWIAAKMHSHYHSAENPNKSWGYQTWREELCKLGKLFGLRITNGPEVATNYGWQGVCLPDVDLLEHELLQRVDAIPNKRTILDIVDDLPEPKRTVVHLWMEGTPHRVIAARYEWSEGQSRIMVHRALGEVRERYWAA